MAWIQRLGQLRSPVSTYANLPLSSNVLGDVRLATDTGDAYTWMLEATSGSLTDWKKVTTSDYNDLVGAPVSTGLDVDNAVKTVVGLSINVAYLGFQVLAEYLSSVARMFDGIIDRFADELGIQSTTDALYSGYLSNHENIKYYLPNKGDLDIQTKLLLHGDGVQGSTSFLDLCRTRFTNHSVITDNSVKKFGTGSLKFDGTNDYIEFTDSDDSNFVANLLYMFGLTYNPNSVTIDFWFNSNASGVQPIFSNSPISNLPGLGDPTFGDGEVFLITKNSSNKIEVVMQHGAWDGNLGQPADAPLTVESTSTISNSTWVHVAVQKNSSGYIELYINGVLEATSSAADLGPIMNTWPSCKLYIGKNGSTYLNGYLDEIRVSYATRYTTTFTPMTKAYNTATSPAPTPVIEDISSGAKTVTVLGNARMSGTNPLFGNASLYLDGIDSYLSLADSDDWEIGSGGISSEPLDSYTKLLIHCDGSNGSQTFVDGCGKSVTAVGQAQISTSEKKFGSGSCSFGGDYLSVADSSDFDFGSGDFTVDTWIRFSDTSGSQHLFGKFIGWSSGYLDIYFDSGTIQFTFYSGTDNGFYCSFTPSVDTWYHFAFVRNGNTWYIFINGVSQSLTLSYGSYSNSIVTMSSAFIIGKASYALGGVNGIKGIIDEFRVSKGIARYTSNFTPQTVPYASFLNIRGGNAHHLSCDSTGTKLFMVAGNPGRLYTSSDSGATWTERRPGGVDNTFYWAATMSSNGLFLIAAQDGGRLYTSSDFGVNWTERKPRGEITPGWYYPSCDSDGSHILIFSYMGSGLKYRIYKSANSGVDWSEVRPLGDTGQEWDATAMDSDGSFMIVGGYKTQAYISTNSGANWTAKTIMADYETDTQYQFACDSDGSNIICGDYATGRLWTSSDSGNNWTERRPRGNANFSWYCVASDSDGSHLLAGNHNDNSYFYMSTDSGATWVQQAENISENDAIYYSMAMNSDGSIAYVTGNYGIFKKARVTLADYTIDLWIDPLSLSDLDTYIIGVEDSWKLTLDGTSNKYLKYSVIGGASIIAPITLSLETWQHVAIVQKDGTLKLYVNGVLGASIAGSVTVNTSTVLSIGATSTGTHLFNGFIEEVRISKGIARWTAAFTPPAVEYSSDSYTKLLLPLNVQTVPNMVLQSVGYVANYVPTSARVVIFEEDIDEMEPNVDLVIEISRDGGATFTTCLIAKDQEFGDGTLNLFTGSLDLQSQPNGELLVWRLTTQNNKDCRIRGVSLSWR